MSFIKAKICIFTRVFHPSIGGLERLAFILADEFSALGHEVEVVTDTAEIAGADYCRLPFKIIRTSTLLGRLIAFNRADVVLFMNLSLPGLVAATLSRARIVLSHHGVYSGTGLLRRFLERCKRELTRFYPNISVSRFVAENLPGRSVIIPNAYDKALFGTFKSRKRTRDFVFCGRLVSDKGADLCLRSFARVVRNLPSLTLTIIGEGPEHPKLVQLARDFGIRNSVKFTGALVGSDLFEELSSHVCMVVSSLCEEGFGIVALEGAACCDTLIVSRRGGLPEAVGDCGLIVDPEEAALANAMLGVVQAYRSGTEIPGQPSLDLRRTHLANHFPEKIARKYLEVLAG